MGAERAATRGNGLLVRRIHRWLGAAVLVFVLILAATGVMLNHSAGLNLAGRYVGSDAVLAWYGIDAPAVEAGYRLAGDDWVVQAAGQIFLNGDRIAAESAPLLGAAALAEIGIIAVAFPETLYLFTPRGELVEDLDRADGLPRRLERIGVTAIGTLVVDATAGRFEADRQITVWSPLDAGSVRWTQSARPPPSVSRRAGAEARRHLITWERLLLDLHSGRLFGRAGIWAFDLAAAALVLLGGTGLYVWWKTPGRRRRRSRRVNIL